MGETFIDFLKRKKNELSSALERDEYIHHVIDYEYSGLLIADKEKRIRAAQRDRTLTAEEITSQRKELEQTARIADILKSPEGFALIAAHAEKKGTRSLWHLREMLRLPAVRQRFSLYHLKALLEVDATLPEGHYQDIEFVKAFLDRPEMRKEFSLKEAHEFAQVLPLMSKTRKYLWKEGYDFYRYFDKQLEREDEKPLNASALRELCNGLLNFYPELDKRLEHVEAGSKDPIFHDRLKHLVRTMVDTGVLDAVPLKDAPKFIEELFGLPQGGTGLSKEVLLFDFFPNLLKEVKGLAPAFTFAEAKRIHAELIGALSETPSEFPNWAIRFILPQVNKWFGEVSKENWRERVTMSSEFAQSGGIATWDLWMASEGIGSLLDMPKDWDRLLEYVKKHVRKSIDRARPLAALQSVSKEYVPMLKFVFEENPKELVDIARQFLLAQRLDIKIPKQYSAWLSPVAELKKLSGLKKGKDWDAEAAGALLRYFSTDSADGTFAGDYARLLALNGKEGPGNPAVRKSLESAERALVRKDLPALLKISAELSKYMGTEVFAFLKGRLQREIAMKAKATFKTDAIDPKVFTESSGLFYDAFVMYNRLISDRYSAFGDDDKEMARGLIQAHLEGRAMEYVRNLPHNLAWLSRLSPEDRAFWLSENPATYQLDKAALSRRNAGAQLKHFTDEAVRCLAELRIPAPNELTLSRLLAVFRSLKPEDYKNDPASFARYKDLETQIRALRNISSVQETAELPKSLTISIERNPANVLHMGESVQGSCLSVDGTNYWGAFSNALDLNKAVVWIKNEKGEVVGRTLIAIDDDGNLLRSWTYYRQQFGVDLDPFVDRYLIGIKERLKLGINGSEDRVSKGFSRWYRDGVKIIDESAARAA